MNKVYQYPSCSTCRKALKFLNEKGVEYTSVHLVEETPSYEELKALYEKSGLSIKKFFNTSGLKYKELGLKDKLPKLSDEEALKLLASDGMLIKRPILANDEKILIGFKEDEWNNF
jgi:arsenate reductase